MITSSSRGKSLLADAVLATDFNHLLARLRRQRVGVPGDLTVLVIPLAGTREKFPPLGGFGNHFQRIFPSARAVWNEFSGPETLLVGPQKPATHVALTHDA